MGRGDDGFTDIPRLGRVRKSHPMLEAYGTVDELMSILGYAETIIQDEAIKDVIRLVQEHLFRLNSCLALGDGVRFQLPNCVEELEKLISKYESDLSPLSHFIYPGGSTEAAVLHLCRSVARRAERAVARLMESLDVDPAVPVYLNRLSTLLFTLARLTNRRKGLQDREWIRG